MLVSFHDSVNNIHHFVVPAVLSLGGGFKYVLISPLVGEDFPFD